MSVRDVLIYPHPSLKARARELDHGADAETIKQVSDDLVETMLSFGHCVGIAAPQIDELVRIVVVDVTGNKRTTDCHGLLVLVNPIVDVATGSKVQREGCLSIPDFTANVRRATEITVSAFDPAGGFLTVETSGFEARCILHELDHLDGLLFLDRVESLKDDVFRRRSH